MLKSFRRLCGTQPLYGTRTRALQLWRSCRPNVAYLVSSKFGNWMSFLRWSGTVWLWEAHSFSPDLLDGLEKGKVSPRSITERRVPELISVPCSQPAGDASHKPGGRLPLLSSRPAVTTATLKRAATCFAAWWTEAQLVWTVCLRLLPNSVAAAIWTQAFLRLSPAR